nr:uncharacterized protein LOC119186668 [Rhipicephalus microplus]
MVASSAKRHAHTRPASSFSFEQHSETHRRSHHDQGSDSPRRAGPLRRLAGCGCATVLRRRQSVLRLPVFCLLRRLLPLLLLRALSWISCRRSDSSWWFLQRKPQLSNAFYHSQP